jgi:hypothetical protein
MDDKYLPQHTRLAMGLSIPESKKVVKAMRGGGAVNKHSIKRLRGGGAVKKTGIKK